MINLVRVILWMFTFSIIKFGWKGKSILRYIDRLLSTKLVVQNCNETSIIRGTKLPYIQRKEEKENLIYVVLLHKITLQSLCM